MRTDLAEGRFESAAALLDEASVLHVPGVSGLAGEYQGREAILGLDKRLVRLTSGTHHFASSRVLSETKVAVVVRGRAQAWRHGKELDVETVHLITFRNDVVREFWIFHENQASVDLFWDATF